MFGNTAPAEALAADEGVTLSTLAGGADVFSQGYRPGALAGLVTRRRRGPRWPRADRVAVQSRPHTFDIS